MAVLVPELMVADIRRSLAFYLDVLGFQVMWQRPKDRFAYLGRDGAEIMLEQSVGRHFLAALLEYPYGRGMNLQIRVADVDALHRAVLANGAPILLPMEVKWYRTGDFLSCNRQFVVVDPDGYLLRFYTDLGKRGED